MPTRFIVRFRASAPAKDITARLHASKDIQVITETGRMLLVEAKEADLLDVVKPSPEVVIVPERHYERPDANPSVEEPS